MRLLGSCLASLPGSCQNHRVSAGCSKGFYWVLEFFVSLVFVFFTVFFPVLLKQTVFLRVLMGFSGFLLDVFPGL